MREITKEELKEAKIYFGHRTFKWHPKFKPFIYKKQFGIHFIDLDKTKEYLEKAMQTVNKIGREGKKIMWVGTKKQAAPIIKEWAEKCGCNYVNFRWLAGILTNFSTISQRLDQMQKLEEMLSEENIGKDQFHTKKEKLILKRELEKLHKNLLGLKGLKKLPELIFVVDVGKEYLAVQEAKKMNIPLMAIVDTNINPNLVDHVIPANDDSIKSIEFILKNIAEAYIEGRDGFEKKASDYNAANEAITGAAADDSRYSEEPAGEEQDKDIEEDSEEED